jgi:hypothetical protein
MTRRSKKGDLEIVKRRTTKAPKDRRQKVGYVDWQGRIWIKDRAHGDYPDHWDVQEGGGEEYFRVDMAGNLL